MKDKIIQGDCLEIMKGMPDKCVDLVLTDPPFGLPNEDFDLVYKAIIEMKRISKMQIIILDWRNPLTIQDGKFAELIWEYGWISGGRTKSNHFYPTHNTIHFLGEDLFLFDTKKGSIIKRQAGFSSPRQCSYAKKSGHPFEKPVKLIEYLIERSKAKIILDPFAGSGTTGVACKNLNRNYILIEKEPEYIDIINKRLQ
jgi:site-specific DNA-methyltransferase (adenine-specific)